MIADEGAGDRWGVRSMAGRAPGAYFESQVAASCFDAPGHRIHPTQRTGEAVVSGAVAGTREVRPILRMLR
jgi:hypothetical protein